MDLGTRPLLHTSPPKAAWLPAMVAALGSRAYHSDRLDCESNDEVLHASAPATLSGALPRRTLVESEVWMDAGAGIDLVGVKAGS